MDIVMPIREIHGKAQDWTAPAWYETAPKTVQDAPQDANTVPA
jgi:hypothetical protein